MKHFWNYHVLFITLFMWNIYSCNCLIHLATCNQILLPILVNVIDYEFPSLSKTNMQSLIRGQSWLYGRLFTTTCAISAYHHLSCEFEPRSCWVYSIQHYVIKFVSDLQQVDGFLRVLWFSSPIKLTATI